MGSRATLDIFQMKKTLAPAGNQILDHPAHSLINHYTKYAILALITMTGAQFML